MSPLPPIATTVGLPLASDLFVPFAVSYMQPPLKLDYLWATVCLVGAVYFIFRA